MTETQSNSPGKGLLLVTMEPPASVEEEFNDWYDHEHLPQRMLMPGFETGARFVCLEGWPRWLALYDLTSLAALRRSSFALCVFPTITSLASGTRRLISGRI